MKTSILLAVLFLFFACGNEPESSIEVITNPEEQDSLFNSLLVATEHTISPLVRNDSLSFLILPVQASCPSCRKKTIDSIIKHKPNLPNNHYIIISADGGRKTINSYFREQGYEIPEIKNRIFLDSNNLTYKHNLYKMKPTIYYAYSGKVYKKVAAVPASVREDLREFFSGDRKSTN